MLSGNDAELLSAYVDRELYGPELKRLNERLAESPEYREEVRNLRRTKFALQNTPMLQAPADLLENLEQMARQHIVPAPQPFLAGARQVWAAAAFAAVLALAGLWMQRKHLTEVQYPQIVEANGVAMDGGALQSTRLDNHPIESR